MRVKSVLDHFAHVSGLKLNYDKSSLIALGCKKPAWFNEDCVQDFKKLHISEGFEYLGLTSSNSRKKLADNFPYDPNLINRILDLRAYKKTSLSGRILQMWQLVSSMFVYRFQLLPSPNVVFMKQIERDMTNFVWEKCRHRLRKEILAQPIQEGGFGMVNICLTSLMRAKCGTRSTLCWKILNISDSTELFAL